MILIAESGATKTDWKWRSKDGKTYSVSTAGLNPLFWTSKEMAVEIRKKFGSSLLNRIRSEKPEVFFYGASCSNPSRKKIVAIALQEAFPGSRRQVHHDVLASARALLWNQKGIACILGTGSNSCYYDGKKILQTLGGHAFILGDEGGGAHLGLQLIKAWLNDELPSGLRRSFNARYKLTRNKVFEAVYAGKYPSRYLAGFSSFIHEHQDHPWLKKMILGSFRGFLDKTVCRYRNYRRLPVGFVGSVAHHYSKLLKEVCREKKIRLLRIIQSPANDLLLYHIQNQKIRR